MSKKTNKHRPAKRVRPPTTRVAPPAKRTASTKIIFFEDNYGRYVWQARRGGSCVAESASGFSSRDKAVRSLSRLIASFASGDWKMAKAAVK